jgi:hypothetical protein
MSRDTETIIIFIGVVYLCLGLAGCMTPVFFLLAAPMSAITAPHSLIFWATQILILGPFFLIAYAWIRRRRWGRYLLIAYNGLWFAYMSYGFVARIINYSESHLVLVIAGFLIPLIVLGGLIVFAFQKDVKALMSY